MYQAVLSQEKAKAFVDQIFGKYDTDKSGEIDFKVRKRLIENILELRISPNIYILDPHKSGTWVN